MSEQPELIEVRNKHCASVLGVMPGRTARMTRETLNRFRAFFAPVHKDPPRVGAAPPPKTRPTRRSAKVDKREIQLSSDPEFLRTFLDDTRPTVRKTAERRLELLARDAD